MITPVTLRRTVSENLLKSPETLANIYSGLPGSEYHSLGGMVACTEGVFSA
jgi:hypothetical protein